MPGPDRVLRKSKNPRRVGDPLCKVATRYRARVNGFSYHAPEDNTRPRPPQEDPVDDVAHMEIEVESMEDQHEDQQEEDQPGGVEELDNSFVEGILDLEPENTVALNGFANMNELCLRFNRAMLGHEISERGARALWEFIEENTSSSDTLLV